MSLHAARVRDRRQMDDSLHVLHLGAYAGKIGDVTRDTFHPLDALSGLPVYHPHHVAVFHQAAHHRLPDDP